MYRIKKNAADNLRKEKKKRDEAFGFDGSRPEEPPIAVHATRIRQNLGTPPVQNLSHSDHMASGNNGAINLNGGKHSIDIHIGNVNTYNIYVHPDAKGLNLSAPPDVEHRKAPNSRVLKANVPNLVASGKSVSNPVQGVSGNGKQKHQHNQGASKTSGDSSTGVWSGFHQLQPSQQQTLNSTAGSFKIGKVVKRNNFLTQTSKDPVLEKRNGSPNHNTMPATPPLPTVAVGQGSVLSKYRMYQTNPNPPSKKRSNPTVGSEPEKISSLASTGMSGIYRSTVKQPAQMHMLSGVTLKAL